MYIQCCDRCGRVTKNKPAFLLPGDKDNYTYQLNGIWWGDPVVLCNNCLQDFDKFRYEHERFNRSSQLIEEDKFNDKEKFKLN